MPANSPYAWAVISTDNPKRNHGFSTHMFVDVIVFYSLITIICLIGLAAHLAPGTSFARGLHKRIRFPGSKLMFEHGATVGEFIVWITIIIFFVFWLLFWRYLYITRNESPGAKTRIQKESESGEHADLQIWARIFGHLSNLAFSLVLFPVCRNSMWESVFGIPFERAIKWHRIMGGLAFMCVTIHLLIWMVKWGLEGNLANLINYRALYISPPNFFVLITRTGGSPEVIPGLETQNYVVYSDFNQTDYEKCPNAWGQNTASDDDFSASFPNDTYTCECTWNLPNITASGDHVGQEAVIPHWDNPLIVILFWSWILLWIVIIIAIKARRNNYELFHFTHHFVWFYYVVAVFHSWALWYFLCAPATLYLVDKCIRLSRGMTQGARAQVTVVPAGDKPVTRLKIAPPQEGKALFLYHAASYAFVNVPEISLLEWHPFTIASAPTDDDISFAIKDMGQGTWTNRLAQLASDVTEIDVRLDAPYGRAYFTHQPCLLLFAGGIGITPMHSIFREICLRIQAGDQVGALRKVVIVWSSRENSELCMFAETWQKCANMINSNIEFEMHIHNTSKDPEKCKEEPTLEGVPDTSVAYTVSILKGGRPDYGGVFQTAIAAYEKECLAMVCGPAALVANVSELCFEHDIEFHTEIFAF